MVSIVVPTYNEKDSIKNLLEKVKESFKSSPKNYEVVCIDDHSIDGTWEILQKEKTNFPLKVFKKEGQKGKAFSLVEGFQKSAGEFLVMIDADLQYPAEAIPEMVKALKDFDVVVANRKNYHHSPVRKFLSRSFRYLFGKFLFGIDCDIQSGLKAFRRQVFETAQFKPKSQWTFDLEFLRRAERAGFKIASFDITFNPRKNGHSKLGILKTTWEIGTNAIGLKLKRIHPAHIAPTQANTMHGAGVGFKGKKYITHSTLSHTKSALKTLVPWQKAALLFTLLALGVSFYFAPKNTAIGLIGVISSVYFIDVLFNAFLIFKSLKSTPEVSFTEGELSTINDQQLSTYTILCPLYKEADILPQFIASIQSLDWPKEKLEVLLLLEEDDKRTQEVAKGLYLPSYFKVIIVPTSFPKTKPKACNYGLHHATGKYLVIYDAEDRPDPWQLKKAYLAFEKYGDKISCFQAKLNYYNSGDNLLTRFFTAEYSLWFGLTLTGLQAIGTAIPLGGTSNHFKTKDIRDFEGWDPFNVTEDADLGVRLFKAGHKTAIIDSITLEEANSKVGNWLRQRSRWIKGYIQTFLVHNRDLPTFIKNQKKHALLFQLIVGGKIAFILINPFMWATTIAYFALRPIVGPTIEQFFPTAIFYVAAFCLVAGNFLYLYYYMIAAVKQEKFSLVKFILAIPIYWVLISTAFWLAAYQLIFKPHYWEKTVHGLHFAKQKEEEMKEQISLETESGRQEKRKRLRELISSGTFAGGLLVIATVIGNFLNFIYNAYLARTISVEDFGLVSLIGSFLFLSTIPLNALGRTVSHKSAYYLGKYQTSIKDFWRITRKKAIIVSLLITVVWVALTPVLTKLFKAPSWEPFILFAPVWLMEAAASVDGGFLSGNLMFKVVALMAISETLAKLIFTFSLVNFGQTHLVYAAIPASIAISFLIGWAFANTIKQSRVEVAKKIIQKFPVHFFITSSFTKISVISFLSFDLILAKIFLSPVEAGHYALISLVGKMIFFVGNLFNQFITPLVSREEGASRNSKVIFYKLFLLSTLTSSLAYIAVGLFGNITVPILLGGKVQPILYALPLYGFGMLCFTAASSIVNYYQTKNQHLFPIVSLLIAAAQVIGISLYHQNLNQIVTVMVATGISSIAIMLSLHFIYSPLTSVARGLKDIAQLFQRNPKAFESGGKKILIFNWRDTRHVWAGGAEVYIHELAKKLVEKGDKVTVFCSNDRTCLPNEIIDGVEVIRRGGHYTVYFWAFIYYIFKLRGKYDVIIDSENGIPFFTPIYVRKPIIGLVFHIHLKEVFDKHLPWLIAKPAHFLEKKAMPFVYKKVKMITISNSSKEEMEKIGLGKEIPINIIHPGVDLDKYKSLPKTENPSILYLGRLKPYKSVDRLIQVFAEVIKKIPNATLTIAGEGESHRELEEMAVKLGLRDFIKFLGKVSEETKIALFAKSWVVAQPSKSEGWGITVIEANACGTPVVASDVPGLRDSVKNPHSGLLITWDNQEKWTNALISILTDKEQRISLEKYAKNWAKNFTWAKSTSKLSTVLRETSK